MQQAQLLQQYYCCNPRMYQLAVSTKQHSHWRTQQAARLEARVARERAVEAVGEDGDQVAVQQAQLLRQRRHRLARRRGRHQVQRPRAL